MASVPFTVCDTVTRRILRMGQCRPSDLPLQAQQGEVVIAAQATDQESQRLNATLDALESAPPPALATLRARAQALLDQRYEDVLTGSIPYGGQQIPTCPMCRARLARAALASRSIRIRARSGVWLTLTASDCAALGTALDSRDAQLDTDHANLTDAISSATTRAELSDLLPAIRALGQ